MDNKKVFERDGKQYEILQDGVKYIAENSKKCIRRGKSSVTIKTAEGNGLIQVIADENGSLFSEKIPGDLEKNEISIAEPHPTDRPEKLSINSTTDYTYFMPVDQLRAQVFLAHGLIYPAVYDKAGLSADFKDSQSRTPAVLTLYKTPQPLSHNQLLLKVWLRQDEIDATKEDGDILHLATPLPISRLAGIDVSQDVGDIDHYIKGWVKPDVPVPPLHLFTHEADPPNSNREDPTSDSPPRASERNPEIIESINKFDRYLGLMAFLRNEARYFSAKTGKYADYPDVFFRVCEQVIDKPNLAPPDCPKPEPLLLALLGINTQTKGLTDSVLQLAISPFINEEEARNCATEIYEATGKNETLAQAFKALFSGDYRSAIAKLQSPELPVEAAVLAVLFKYSVSQSNDHRTVKQRLHEDWSDENRVCLVLAALGAYYGYTALDARETALYSVHPLIEPLIEKYPEIKFHLQTRFEYQLIEAIYQWAFFPNKPACDSSLLFNSIPVAQVPAAPRVQEGVSVRDSSYTVEDLVVHQYEVTLIEPSVQPSQASNQGIIDEFSKVEKCSQELLRITDCGDEYEISMAGKDPYRIKKSNKFVEYVLSIVLKVLEPLKALLKADNTKDDAK